MSNCDAIRERLADEGVEAADAVVEIKHHLEGCADCTRFLDELRQVEDALQDLPPHDAPDALVAETLRAVRRAAEAQKAPARPSGIQRYAASTVSPNRLSALANWPISSLTPVSADPPSVLMCIGGGASSRPAMVEGQTFCANTIYLSLPRKLNV